MPAAGLQNDRGKTGASRESISRPLLVQPRPRSAARQVFAVGTLRELAFALRRVRSVLHKRGILKPERMRDDGAFHVDEDVIEKGIGECFKTLTSRVSCCPRAKADTAMAPATTLAQSCRGVL